MCRVVHDSVDIGEEEKENGPNVIQNNELACRNDQWKWRKTLLKDLKVQPMADLISGSAKPQSNVSDDGIA